jgi:transposase InsO family protein
MAGRCHRRRCRTTFPGFDGYQIPDLVGRRFDPGRPDVAWCQDITYIPTGEGWLFLATVIDRLSRPGHRLGCRRPPAHPARRLGARDGRGDLWRARRWGGVALRPRLPGQYTSGEYRELCERLGVTQSMGATGICFDNSPAEAFFATLKRELVHRRRFATRAEARREIIRWIEGWYNARRLHSSIAYLTPNEKEATWHTDRLAA